MDKKIIYLFAIVAILAISSVAALNYFSNNGQITDPALSNIKKTGKLAVAINPPYEPLEYYDGPGNMVGLDVDMAREIASRIGVSLEIKPYEKWDELLLDVQNGKVDMGVSGISITSERSVNMLFSTPYINNGMILLSRSGDERIKSVNDLSGKKIGTIKESTWETEALKHTNSSLVVSYEDPKTMLESLKNGTVDAVIYDYIMSGRKAGLLKGENAIVVVGRPFTEDFIAIATSKNSTVLMEETNKILNDMKRSGKLGEIIDRWI